ncbi:MAG TPA: M1 family metallopeptidase [Gemmatimonadales bacterium]|nr:M1 family metallopeptidase [Gemmatimonadales bacterium]
MFSLLLALISTDSTYWQQRVAYEINASLAESTGVLSGRARIRYVNQSPDTLRDFAVHQYLNAFRPGSRWAAADSAEDRVRFQHLRDPDYAFERITAATVMGELRTPDYPYAPDSTIAHWALPRPLAPGDSFVVEIDWQARPSTLPRRQGREGRRFDFAQWYPKVVVYDKYGWETHPLYPGGEFYGEFASFDVTLDLAEDQVIGATGVPIEGDPGWEKAKADRNLRIDYQRDWYRAPRTAHRCGEVGPARKCVRFYADSVHHFAFSLNPAYVYEEGRYGDVVVRALYQPGDSVTWGRGTAVRRTEMALGWLDKLFGKFAWPQITNVHRIEAGGTEFPMMVMDGGAGIGLIVHEVGHNYTMGILANNEWREGWLDEGFTSFQTGWYFESQGQGPAYPGIEGNILFWDIERWSEPVSMISEGYRDFTTYNMMIYTKAQLFYEQLRYVVGDDVMRRILRTYYARWRLKHVDEDAFRTVAEEVSRMDLKWLFGQWLHGTPLIDYRLTKVERHRLAGDRWRTVVTIDRLGDGWMPMEIGDGDTVYARSSGQPATERVEFVTDHEPDRLILDPHLKSHDWNALNNREKRPIWGRATRLVGRDDPTREAARRDRIVTAVLPLLWFNDYGGRTAAVRARENYLGRFDKNVAIVSVGLGPAVTHRVGGYVRFGNPVSKPLPRTEASIALWNIEGRAGAAMQGDRSLRSHLGFGADRHAGFDAIWMAVNDLGYVDRRLWDAAGTIEGGPWVSTTARHGGAVWQGRLGARAGIVYRNPGVGTISAHRYDVEGFARATGEVSVRAPFPLKSVLGVRLFGGTYLALNGPPLQRRIMLAGADPYETFLNPLLRSRGALFVRPGFHYHAPGNANLRGFRPDLGGRWAVAMNVEGTKTLFRRGGGLFADAALETFFDVGLVDPRAVPPLPGAAGTYTSLYDGGVGLVTRHRINELAWTLRFEVPLVVSRFDYAADWNGRNEGRAAFRWQVSLEPSF